MALAQDGVLLGSQEYPLWDGAESVASYARRVGLPPAKTLDLGNGVKLEMVLIPAGKFIMGTPDPTPVDEVDFLTRIWVGQFALRAGLGVLLVLIGTVVIRAIRQRRRPQYSLVRFVAMIVTAGVALLGGLHWRFSGRRFSEAKAEYRLRYDAADCFEKPAHEVKLTKPYYMGKFEVTQEQYQQVMGTNPSHRKGRDLPVEGISWDDAQEFCTKASEKTGQNVRLPTDAEWEHACRAGTKTAYNTGDAKADLDRAGWYCENSGYTIHTVGQKAPNQWGLYDMHGNVMEWCHDAYVAHQAIPAVDPQFPFPGQCWDRVLRGGGTGILPEFCRSASRFQADPGKRSTGYGFRVVAGTRSHDP
jgi:formylglycine-generating enzyme required for sulfatase activity